MRLDNQVAYVTGASSGIGQAAAVRLAAEGAVVVLLGRNGARLAAAADQCAGRGHILELDVTKANSIDELLPVAIAKFGRPGIVVHAAGETVLGALHELSESQWDRQFDTNLKSIYFLNKHFWPHMQKSGGSIVMIASTASFGAFPGDAAYVASKGAVLALTKAMALDGAAHGIRVNAVCPGFILTPNLQGYFDGQTDPAAAARGAGAAAPLDRLGSPEDVAGAIAFFASTDSSFITGASLLVDGGLMAKVPV